MPQTFIMLVGFSHSGKSTLAKKIQKEFSNKFIRIDSNAIHNFLNKNYSIFQDDNTIQGESFNLRQKTTKTIQNILLDTLLKEGCSIILDTCNLSKEKRRDVLNKIKYINKKIKTIIIHLDISEEKLYKRLKRADQKMIQKEEKPVWVDLYKKIQKDKFDLPQKNEVDFLLTLENPRLLAIIRKIIRD